MPRIVPLECGFGDSDVGYLFLFLNYSSFSKWETNTHTTALCMIGTLICTIYSIDYVFALETWVPSAGTRLLITRVRRCPGIFCLRYVWQKGQIIYILAESTVISVSLFSNIGKYGAVRLVYIDSFVSLIPMGMNS